ncbi:uncharacterized protein LOC133368457 [Rhineura floridana]|uniref:uncharacterized protein LOC133368457 n=1 Tax=Rhineura floridana TaxID=261503 RepID=UPI002AC83A89|nr:uncharacterized protein LOC133368457 [Rhineura floridana]
MEMLPKVIWSDPQPTITSPDICAMEGYGYARGQGSPTPGETASPKSYFQQSPSLPASGLTEFSGVDPVTWDTSPSKTQALPAVRDSALTAGVPRKQYVGVRVKMPVCELLRKIRLSKGTESSDIKETPGKVCTKKTSKRAGKKRAHSERPYKQNSHQAALKSVEDLDILVEVLQEDLDESHSKLGLQLPMQCELGGVYQEAAAGNPQPNGNWLGSSWETDGIQSFSTPGTLPHPCAENFYGFDCRKMQQRQNSCVEERPCLVENGAVVHPRESFQGFGREIRPHGQYPLGHDLPETLEDDAAALYDEGHPKSSAGSFVGQEAAGISLFQFQLHREESWLRNTSVDKLLTPDKNGNRLLHKAVAQGERALAYVLAWRFAHLNIIDGKNEEKQTALHIAAGRNHHLIASDLISLGAHVNVRDSSEKTPLHLCAEKGYLKVLEVLKSCQENGIHVEVDATDNQGLTPLQCAALAHCTHATDLGISHLSPEAWKLLNLHQDQILSGIKCLMQMGADPWWGQGTNPSTQVSNYFAKVQQNNELMCFFPNSQAPMAAGFQLAPWTRWNVPSAFTRRRTGATNGFASRFP